MRSVTFEILLLYTRPTMHQTSARLLAAFSPHPDATLLRLETALPNQELLTGQFLMAKVAGVGWDPFLREPLFLAGHEAEGGTITLWVPGGTPLRERLRTLPLHAELDLLGPMGIGITPHRQWRNLLLIAEGLAVGPLLAAMESALRLGQSVTLLSITPPEQSPYPADALPVSIEYQRAPRGSAGEATRELLQWADGVIAAGSQRFYRDLVEELKEVRPGQRGGFAYGLLLEPFGWESDAMRWGATRVACASAACRACLVELRREKPLACTDGPLFDLWAL